MTRAPLVPHDAPATLGAGGIAALGAKLADDQRATAVTARSYSHPALDGKVIIRLEPEAVAIGTDAEMAAFGFSAPEVSEPLGQVRFRTLGFPAWALVNDPKKAKAALDVTDDMRKAKRLVQAKPGHAKDAFEKIAKTLSRGTPQFLPSFWEEVGRVVADQASSSMAAQCFERARQAERAYKLKIDAEDTDAVFVEFALLGALSAKTLSQYAKDLAKTAGGKEAFRRFRAIIIKRSLGGMPPYSGMGKDLQALAKGAGLDVDAEADALARELIEAPGINKAPSEFWSTYRDALVRIGKSNADARARLRNLWPAPRGGGDETRKAFQSGTWMTVLEEIGALADLPDEGLGTWLSKLFVYAGKTERTTALLEELAPRLIALKQPIRIVTPRSRWGTDLHLDLAERALELGVALDDPGNDDFFPESMTVDPVLVAGHAVYGKKLTEAVAGMMGEAEHEPRMRNKQGFAAARRQWISDELKILGRSTFSRTTEALNELDQKTTAETFVPFEDLQQQFAATDLAESLALHLRAGTIDEFGWPEYEKLVASFGDVPVRTGGAFPVLTVWSQSKVFALDHTGVRAEHDIVAKPKEFTLERALFFGDQLFVELDPVRGYPNKFYWASNPKELHDQKAYLRIWSGASPYAYTLPDGTVTLGNKAFVVGGTEITGSQNFAVQDGKMWARDYRAWKPYDPTKGSKLADDGGPPWIAAFKAESYELNNHASWILPAPAGLTSSPLGIADGMLGVRAREIKDEVPESDPRPRLEAERIDGKKLTGAASRYLLAMPGDDSLRAVSPEEVSNKRFLGGDGPGATISAPEGGELGEINKDAWTTRGWGNVPVPPVAFWHYLSPRDVASSAALRSITVEQARTILAAAIADAGAAGEPQTRAAIASALPAVTNAAIVEGIVGHAVHAAELSARVQEMATSRHKDNADASGTALVGQAGLLHKIGLALAAGKQAVIMEFNDAREWLTSPRAQVMLAHTPLAKADERRAAREMAQALSGTVFADEIEKLRYVIIDEPEDHESDYGDDYDAVRIVKHENSVFAIQEDSNWAIEYSTDGVWRALPNKWAISKTLPLRSIGSEWVEKLLALPDEPMAWDPAMAQRTAERGKISLAEATLLFHGAPSRTAWGKDYLGKPKREQLGLKRDDASAANETFKAMKDYVLHGVLEVAVPEDPALLLAPDREGGWADRVGEAWAAQFGSRAKIPQDLIAGAKKDLNLGNELSDLLRVFAGEFDAERYQVDKRPLSELGSWRNKIGLDADHAKKLVTLAAWLFYARPVGCPIRAGVPAVIDKIRTLVGDPATVWQLDSFWIDSDEPKDETRATAILGIVDGPAFAATAPGAEKQASESHDDGSVQVARVDQNVYAGFRPSKLDGAAGKKAEQLAQAVWDQDNDEGGDPLETIKLARMVLSDDVRALGERVATTPVEKDGFEANPLQSAPALVTKVAKAEGISEDAAAVFLQTLALAEPTQKNVTTWNGWAPKRYAAACAELVKKKLVVEGKRERAGRTIFIPGGYTKGNSVNLPTEEWKLPFYAGLDRHIPHEPAHQLFERAYKRRATDAP